MITRNGKHTDGAHIFEGMPATLVHGAEEGATKVAEVVESASARVAKGAEQVAKGAGKSAGQVAKGAGKVAKSAGQGAGQVAKGAGQASGMASELSGQIKGRVAQAPVDIRDAKQGMRRARLSLREAKLGVREMVMRSASRAMVRRRGRLLPSGDAVLKAQLVKTSRELAHESSDLGAAVDSLNKIIKTNRRAAAKGRTRLLSGLALGAALMYHLDAEHGRERRAATARTITSMWRGQRRTPAS